MPHTRRRSFLSGDSRRTNFKRSQFSLRFEKERLAAGEEATESGAETGAAVKAAAAASEKGGSEEELVGKKERKGRSVEVESQLRK